MLGTVKGTPWNPSPPLGFQASFLLPRLPTPQASTEQGQQAETQDQHGQAASSQDRTTVTAARSTQQRDDTTPAPTGETQAKKARTEETKRHRTEGEPTPTAHTTMKLGTSPTPVNRPPTTSRSLDDQIHEGRASKSRKETRQQQAATRPEEAGEQAKKPRMRINAVTVQLKSGKKITTATSEDAQEVRAEQRLLEPHIYNNEGFDTEKLRKGMHKEMESMRAQKVYEETRRYKAHTTTATRTGPRQHHRVQMGLQIQRGWGTSKDCSQRIHRTHRRSGWCVRKHTTVCSTQDTIYYWLWVRPEVGLYKWVTYPQHSYSALAASVQAKEFYHKPQHPVEITQSYVRLT